MDAEHDADDVEQPRPSAPDPRRKPPYLQHQLGRSVRWQPWDGRDLASTAAVRDWARQALPGLLEHPVSDELVHDVELLLGELCTNAIRHGDGLHEVHLHCLPPIVRVTVRDRNTAVPVLYDHTTADPSAPIDHGRGLLLIQGIASRWGVDHHGDAGKDVWCELPIHRPLTS
ncbi:ATP-binding protein [Dactylosporangium sp. CS-047395]|uniref:ATP-binding protein n=1 Tax=Dactylosporangium sp. CS-047395 TaxID=3239936 RepID=UPI003D89DF69